jgi:hypothetical protein
MCCHPIFFAAKVPTQQTNFQENPHVASTSSLNISAAPNFPVVLVIKVISITPHDTSTFLSFPYCLFHQFLLFFVGTIFEPLDLGAPSFSCEHCGAFFLV